MKIEPNLDPSALKGVLRESYGIEPAAGEDPAALAFVPTGWISACYAVGARRGRYFLKLQPLTGPQASAASSPDFYLPLTRQLHDTGILPHIAYPIPTVDGRLWTTWEGWRVIVQNYIDGEVVGHGGMTPAVITELGALVGRLHRAAPRLDLPVAFREAFDIAFEDELVADLEALAALGPEATPGQQGLADLLVPRREEILGYLHRLQALEFSPVRGELEGGVRARTGAGSADPPCIPVPQTAPGGGKGQFLPLRGRLGGGVRGQAERAGAASEFSPLRRELEGGARDRAEACSEDPPCVPVPQTAPGGGKGHFSARREELALSGPVKSMPVDLTGGTEGVEGRAVICHTDLHGENLMRGVDGHLYILDWEGAMLSPPEQDLFFFVGDDTFVPFFLPAYEREVGPVTIDGDLIHFYYLRRGLEDLVDWIRRILSGEGGGERDASDLVEAADNLAGLAEAAPTVARLRREVACVV